LPTDTARGWLWPPDTKKNVLCGKTLEFYGYLPQHIAVGPPSCPPCASPRFHPLPPHAPNTRGSAAAAPPRRRRISFRLPRPPEEKAAAGAAEDGVSAGAGGITSCGGARGVVGPVVGPHALQSGGLECRCGGAATLAEFTLDGSGGLDFFDVSLVDGYNLPMAGAGRCAMTGSAAELNVACSVDLRVGGGVAYRSACDSFRAAAAGSKGRRSWALVGGEWRWGSVLGRGARQGRPGDSCSGPLCACPSAS
jgi:hypothetical protein